jgi:hypothetical protein
MEIVSVAVGFPCCCLLSLLASDIARWIDLTVSPQSAAEQLTFARWH